MKRVLIISNNFSSLESIGSIRIRGLVQYLPQFGWDPLILTQGATGINRDYVVSISPSPGKKENIEASLLGVMPHRSSGLGKFASTVYKNIFWYPDPYRHWRNEGKRTGHEIVLHNKIDAMISSAHAVSSHIIASKLASDFGIPWVADFRDLWTQNHYNYQYNIRTFFERRLEITTLKYAGALVTVSEPLSKKIAELHKGRPVYTIPNGFNPDQINSVEPRTDKLTITYTGNLYKGKRDPTLLLEVLREMIDKNLILPDRIAVHFYGREETWLFDTVERLDLTDTVRIHGPVSREESIEKQRISQILLLLTWDNPGESGVYTGKLFDYLAARRPILSLGFTGKGVVQELLEETNAGVHASDEGALKDILSALYREFDGTGRVRFEGIESEIMKYSQIEMAKRFAQVLDTVSSAKNGV